MEGDENNHDPEFGPGDISGSRDLVDLRVQLLHRSQNNVQASRITNYYGHYLYCSTRRVYPTTRWSLCMSGGG